MIESFRWVYDRLGPARAVVGHSLGCASACRVLLAGAQAERLCLVSPNPDMAVIGRGFARQIGLAPAWTSSSWCWPGGGPAVEQRQRRQRARQVTRSRRQIGGSRLSQPEAGTQTYEPPTMPTAPYSLTMIGSGKAALVTIGLICRSELVC